jgi:hypothetical protein
MVVVPEPSGEFKADFEVLAGEVAVPVHPAKAVHTQTRRVKTIRIAIDFFIRFHRLLKSNVIKI